MGAQHRINGLSRVTGLLQIFKKWQLQLIPAWHAAWLVVTNTGIDDDFTGWRLDDQRMDAHDQLAAGIDEVGFEPIDVGHCLWCRLG